MPLSSLPVTVDRRLGRGPAKLSARASSVSRTLRFYTAVLPYWRQAEWSAVQNSSYPLSTVTRCPVMTQDAVRFSGAVFVRSGRASSASFTGRQMNPLPGVTSTRPCKRAGMKVSRRTCSAGPKASLISGVTFCMNAHSWINTDATHWLLLSTKSNTLVSTYVRR